MNYRLAFSRQVLFMVAAIAAVLGGTNSTAHAAFTSAQLWARYVTNPNADPNIPNCSYAGYHYSEVPLPEPKVVANVKTEGAVGDGNTDDTEAFHKAIDKAGAAGGGAVLVPAGTYSISGIIHIKHDGVVLRGEGVDKTTLIFHKSLSDIVGELKGGSSSQFSWSGGLVWIGPDDTFDDQGKIAGPHGIQAWESWRSSGVIGAVTAPAKRGDFVVQVDDAAAKGLAPKKFVLMTWQNPPDKSLLIHMAGSPVMENYPWDTQGKSLEETPSWVWPVEIAEVKGNAVTLRQPLRIDIRPEWKVSFETPASCLQEAGVEKMTLKMINNQPYKHLTDRGFNGIYFNRCFNCFARDIHIVDPQNGVIHAAAKNTTVINLVISGKSHHHATALRVGSHDNLISDFRIESLCHHGINTEGMSTGNVWRNGVMLHGTFDSHCAMSFESMRTNIQLTSDGGPGGGGESGPFLGGHMVHWNINMTNPRGKAEWINSPDDLPMGALVGIQNAPNPKKTGGWHMIPGDKGCIVADEGIVPAIKDLFQAQLDLRLKKH